MKRWIHAATNDYSRITSDLEAKSDVYKAIKQCFGRGTTAYSLSADWPTVSLYHINGRSVARMSEDKKLEYAAQLKDELESYGYSDVGINQEDCYINISTRLTNVIEITVPEYQEP